ncbi:MAG: DNA primase, partial [Pseudomonadota bacterium]
PSFFVNDDKGFYHCFSSGQHGDLISFLQETERLSFYEAVEKLAGEAGVELPKDAREDKAETERRKGLVEACAAASAYFQGQLARIDGRDAREYLERRGVSQGLIDTFGLGFAPNARGGLRDYLVNKGFSLDILVEAGLLIRPDDGGQPYDRFRGRVMFPILGHKDAVIAFGGRALDKNARAKYLNSPETPLFHKGSVLYNYAAARRAAADADAPLIVCEGYMDVIALAGAGFRHAVAPLGTALTERQMALLWRVSDKPVLCFDGDRAGRGAAYRSIDRALPVLKPGKSLQFAFLPEGQDPDDLVRGEGAGAFAKVLKSSKPLADTLWARETETRPLETPEDKAGFRAHLRTLATSIEDKDVRAAYGAEFAERLNTAFAPKTAENGRPWAGRRSGGQGRGKAAGGRFAPQGPATRLTKAQAMARPPGARREAILVLTLLNHPGLLERHGETLADIRFEDAAIDALREALLEFYSSAETLDISALKSHLLSVGCGETAERLATDRTLKTEKFAQSTADIADAEAGWLHVLAMHSHNGVMQSELQDVLLETDRDKSPEAWSRANHLRAQRAAAVRSSDDEADEDVDDVVAS